MSAHDDVTQIFKALPLKVTPFPEFKPTDEYPVSYSWKGVKKTLTFPKPNIDHDKGKQPAGATASVETPAITNPATVEVSASLDENVIVRDMQALGVREVVRFVCVSDTHGMHEQLNDRLPEGDVLIHAGDFTRSGHASEVSNFADWCTVQSTRYKHVVVIAGNHELGLDPEKQRRRDATEELEGAIAKLKRACIFLHDSAVEVLGVTVHGSPYTPEFCDWAFNLPRGRELAKKWDLIPETCDVLVTHGPALGFGDRCVTGVRAGCEDLLSEIAHRGGTAHRVGAKGRPPARKARDARKRPILAHVFGHIHEGYGTWWGGGNTAFINASSSTVRYKCTNDPIVFDIALEKRPVPAEAVTVE